LLEVTPMSALCLGREFSTFGKVGVMSPALRISPNYVAQVNGEAKQPLRVHLDIGTAEGQSDLDNCLAMYDTHHFAFRLYLHARAFNQSLDMGANSFERYRDISVVAPKLPGPIVIKYRAGVLAHPSNLRAPAQRASDLEVSVGRLAYFQSIAMRIRDRPLG
jgi:hypothetical protein